MFKIHWPAISFLVILGLAVLAQVIAAAEPGACHSSSLQYWSTEQKVPIFACWEFWLNRYQGLIGSVLTAAVAGLTIIWLVRQFDTSRRQTAVAAAQALRQRVSDLKIELNRLETCRRRTLNIRQTFLDLVIPRREIYRADVETARDFAQAEIDQIVDIMDDFYTDVLTESRAIVVGAGHSLRHYLHNDFSFSMSSFLFSDTDWNIPHEDDFIRTDAEIDEFHHILTLTLGMVRDFVAMTRDASLSAREDLERTWKQIRAFEEQAIK